MDGECPQTKCESCKCVNVLSNRWPSLVCLLCIKENGRKLKYGTTNGVKYDGLKFSSFMIAFCQQIKYLSANNF